MVQMVLADYKIFNAEVLERNIIFNRSYRYRILLRTKYNIDYEI